MNNDLISISPRELIKKYASAFSGINEIDKRKQAESIISNVLSIHNIDIYLKEHFSIEKATYDKLITNLERRKNGEPLQYILGEVQFRNVRLKVNNSVLIPRPETEDLINIVNKHIKPTSNIVDVGTGSGAIAISLAKENPNTKVIAIDISEKALLIAKHNAVINNITNIQFVKNNLLEEYEKDSFDIVVANLPYISASEYNELDNSVKLFEPKIALYGGKDGLNFIRKIILQTAFALKNNGYIFLEVGYNQSEIVRSSLDLSAVFRDITIVNDFRGIPRFVYAKK